ncbi:hypothetical protein AGMMS49921_14160 [Endomicrobiia bacterium]|nr:hypothetical protein AGMMS49921_14160 [Endomicrobiia bacterium]
MEAMEMTLMQDAQNKQTNDLIKSVAQYENLSEEFIIAGVAAGTIVIPKNFNRAFKKNRCRYGVKNKS